MSNQNSTRVEEKFVEGQFDDAPEEEEIFSCSPQDGEMSVPHKRQRIEITESTEDDQNFSSFQKNQSLTFQNELSALRPAENPLKVGSNIALIRDVSDAAKTNFMEEDTPLNVQNCDIKENDIKDQDVLSGRGGGTNNHPGNRFYRQLVDMCRSEYSKAEKKQKGQISLGIVGGIRSRGGRFLKKDERSGLWHDIGDKRAIEKTSQAFREGVSRKRRRLEMEHEQSKPHYYGNSGVVQVGAPHRNAYATSGDAHYFPPRSKAKDPNVTDFQEGVHERDITEADVLSGRGGGTNHHVGNRFFRQLVDLCRPEYVLAKKKEKNHIPQRIVSIVRAKGGRFLKKDGEGLGLWKDIGDQKAIDKTSQALREGVSKDMRQALMISGATYLTPHNKGLFLSDSVPV